MNPINEVRDLIRKEVLEQTNDFVQKDELENTIVEKVKSSLEEKLEHFDSKDKTLEETRSQMESLQLQYDNLENFVVDEVEKHMKSMRDRVREYTPGDAELEWTENVLDGRRGHHFEASLMDMRTKAITTYDATPGARQGATAPWMTMIEADPFRQYLLVRQVTGEATVSVPNLTQTDFVATDDAGDSIPDNLAIGSSTHTIKQYTLLTKATRASEGDVPGLRNSIVEMIGNRAAYQQGRQCANTILGSVEGSAGFNKNVTTGVASSSSAAGTPSTTAVTGKLAELMADIDTPYHVGGAYFLSQLVYSALIQATSGSAGDWAFDVSTRTRFYNGVPMIITSHIPKPTAAAKCVAFFGNLRNSVTLLERKNVTLDEYTETTPGSLTYYADMRFLHVITDTDGVTGLITGT